MTRKSDVQRQAEAIGIQTSYLDNTGKERFASEETLRRLIDTIGDDDPGDPVMVAWQGGREKALNFPGAVRVTLVREDGSESELKPKRFREMRQFALPALATGYHNLRIDLGNQRNELLVISAPRKLFAPARGVRQWGVFAPLYAVRSEESWGAGNFSDWRKFSEWVASQGGSVVGTLPILAAFLDHPIVEPSPYSPASRLFWNEFFVDVTAIPEFAGSREAQRVMSGVGFKAKLREFRQAEYIQYAEEWKLRRKVLEVLAREFFANGSRRAEFDAYVKSRPEVQDYAAFRAMCETQKRSWHGWPNRSKAGKLSAGDFPAGLKNFYAYIQWAAQQQIDTLLHACRRAGAKFYLDLPLGVNPDSYDAWKHRDAFAPGVSAGAPPDSFFTKGQDWGFAPLHPGRCRALHYRYVIDFLQFQMRHTGMLRIDHVMGLHRLYWIPHGFPASAGAYVRYRAEELYAILSVESHRHQTMLVGENLGTVPPEVNKSMDRHGLRRMYVLQYEQPAKGPLPKPPKAVAASINTHDMPTFAAHWEGEDIADRADLGLIPKGDLAKARKERVKLKRNAIAFLRKEKLLSGRAISTTKVLHAALQFLARSDAETVLVTLEDLWAEKQPQNTPGTCHERPNWRRKAKRKLEDLGEFEAVLQKLAAAHGHRRRDG